jgi:poly(hydroxyalkanoate) depolymerase family esterase
MKPLSQTAMAEATRLTAAGRLNEAMALLRGAVSSAPAPTPSSQADAKPKPRPSKAPEFIDMVPPSPATGACWTSPLHATADNSSGTESARVFPGLPLRSPPAAKHTTVLPEGARFEQLAFASEVGSRDYKLYIPSSFTGQPVPLLMMLHGCTQSPDDFARGTRMNLLAEEFGFLVAYPAQPKTSNPSRCWNWFRPGDQRRGQGEPALIAGIAQQVVNDYPIARSQIYVAGLSAGGAAAAIMGAVYPDLFAAVGVHSGLACGAASDIPTAFSAMRQGHSRFDTFWQASSSGPVPTIVFHGDQDSIVSPINGDQVIAQAKAGADLTRTVRSGESLGGIKYTCVSEKDQGGRTVLEHWTLHGCGHAWSGGSTEGSYTEPRGPDASREMIRFFLRHRSSDGE